MKDHLCSRPLFAVSIAFLVLIQAGRARAEVRLPRVLGDHMVLQRNQPLRIWGWADPAEKITVSFGRHRAAAVAGKDRRWEVRLPAMPAGGPHELTVAGTNTLKVTDVLVGEVWFCSGQSNMALGVVKSLNHEKEIAAAQHPRIRFLTAAMVEAKEPAADIKADCQVCTPKTVSYFSAVAYYFGRALHQKLNVPVGLVVSAVNGTRIEPWTPAAGVKSVKELAGKDKAQNGLLYNGMVHPFTPLVVRGVIWYQGEGNVGDGLLYYHRMRALIRGWRHNWGLGDLPFYYVQLTPLNWGGKPKDQHAELWEAQAEALCIPNTGMVVTNDIGNIGDAHPKNKQEVGRRLSLWALARTYGNKDVVYSGPIYKSMKVEGSTIRLTFDHAHGGLASRDGKPLTWFTVAGADGVFVPVKAEIDGEEIVVAAKAVKQPAAVRFAWHQAAEPNLMNKAGLPASAFRTDRPEPPKGEARPKYRFSEIMVIVYADFPNEPEHQEALAKYVVSKGFNCVEAEMDKLGPCRKAGLKVLLGSIDINKMLRAAPKLKDDPAVFGYFISDRRRRSAFPRFAKTARDFEAADPNHPTLFINRAEYNQFPEFVDLVKPMVLDYYHYHWWPKNHPERYFLYLKMFRDLSVKHDIPQMRCLASNNPPEKIRQSMYCALAYGVEAFHFWPPWFVTCKMDKHRNAVLEDGKPVFGLSDQGKTVSEICGELKAIGPVLVKLKNEAVYHTDKTLPIGAEKAPADYWFQPEGETFLVGVFRDGAKDRYLLPVNHAVDRGRELTLRFKENNVAVERLDRKTGKWRALRLNKNDQEHVLKMTLAPGDGELLRVKGR
jgi:sialate O-acetylesterase